MNLVRELYVVDPNKLRDFHRFYKESFENIFYYEVVPKFERNLPHYLFSLSSVLRI